MLAFKSFNINVLQLLMAKLKTMKITTFFIILFILFQSVYSQNKKIEITHERKSDRSIDFYYKKNVPGSYYLILEFDNLINCYGIKTYKSVIKYDSGPLLTLKPYNKNQGICFSYKVKYTLGNPNPKIDENITYVLPFKTGKSVKIFEASNLGEKYLGSKNKINWKSFIVYSNKPDTIYSMRKGIVVEIIDKYKNNGDFNKTFKSNRNFILIEHKDGSYAIYRGFDKNKIFIKLGQKVYPHTPLGKLEKFNETSYRLDFNVFHYLENLLDNTKTTLKNINNKTKYINPTFFMDNLHKKIKPNETYKVSFNEEIKLQEFSKREIKKYKKKPNNFQ